MTISLSALCPCNLLQSQIHRFPDVLRDHLPNGNDGGEDEMEIIVDAFDRIVSDDHHLYSKATVIIAVRVENARALRMAKASLMALSVIIQSRAMPNNSNAREYL